MTDQSTETWWMPRQLALVEDRSRAWRSAQFAPTGAVETHVDGMRLTRKVEVGEAATPGLEAEWDHEHCALCWRKISAYPEDEHSGFTDGDNWLCAECFQRYIKPRLNAGLSDGSGA